MNKYFVGLLIVLALGVGLLLFFNQGLFTASEGVIEPADDAVKVGDKIVEPVKKEDPSAEEEIIVDALDEEASDEVNEPDGGEGQNADEDAGFTVTEFPYQDFIQARSKGEPIVLKFYSET